MKNTLNFEEILKPTAATFDSIAVLVDADNAEIGKMEALIEKISIYGRITVRRVYGNWQKEILKKWPEVIKRLAFNPQQQFDYVKGKNATDIALVIDAMELMYTKLYDAFVIVSSDSDYTPLCIKLRESGLFVIGAGRSTTSDSFKRSCDEFIIMDAIAGAEETLTPAETPSPEEEATPTPEPAMEAPEDEEAALRRLHKLLEDGAEVEKWLEEDGFVFVSTVGNYIKRVWPEFDIKRFGVKGLTDFIAMYPDRYEMRKGQRGKTIVGYYRPKQ